MHCEKVRLKIDAYLSGELAPQDRCAVEQHLNGCDNCRRAVESGRQLISLGQTSPTPPVPEGFAQCVQAMARQRAARPAPAAAGWNLVAWWRTVSAPMHAAAAAVLVVGLSLGVLIGRNTWRSPTARPIEMASQADPLAPYNVDYLSDAPDGSLAQAYLALVSSQNAEGK